MADPRIRCFMEFWNNSWNFGSSWNAGLTTGTTVFLDFLKV
jgi:hypothetical protein